MPEKYIDLVKVFDLKQKCQTALLLKHVKDHQDENAWYETPRFQSKINIDCEEAVKSANGWFSEAGRSATVPQ